MNILIGHKTGMGNLIQIIPKIKSLIEMGHKVYSKATIFAKLGINVQKDSLKKYDSIFLPFGYDWRKLLMVIFKHPFTPKYGYKYRILGKHYGFGYTKSIKFNPLESEKVQTALNFGGYYDYPKRETPNSKVVLIHYDERHNRGFNLNLAKELFYWLDTCTDLTPILLRLEYTPKISDLINLMKEAEYFIGTDTGVCHIADFLNLKSIVYFGSTDSRKSGIINGHNIQSPLVCSPCYDWGRINCTNPNKYACFKLTLTQIQNDINTLWLR